MSIIDIEKTAYLLSADPDAVGSFIACGLYDGNASQIIVFSLDLKELNITVEYVIDYKTKFAYYSIYVLVGTLSFLKTSNDYKN